MNRRSFLKGATALAALAVIPLPSFAAHAAPPDDTALLQGLLDKGGFVSLTDRVYHVSDALRISGNTTLYGMHIQWPEHPRLTVTGADNLITMNWFSRA